MACDICGGNHCPLEELLPNYQSDTIKQICPTCLKVVNRHQSKLRTITHNILANWLKLFMAERKNQFQKSRAITQEGSK